MSILQATILAQFRDAPAVTTRSLDSPPLSVATVGTWALLRMVGRGQWTEVYQASTLRTQECPTSPALPPLYAVKRVRPDCPEPRRAEQMLAREVEVARVVASPHVVPVLDWNLDPGSGYLVMPWLEGFSLRRLLDEMESLPLADALWIARQLAEGLSALHTAGWLHGDLKPDNVIISAEGHATLIDLGLAVPISSPETVEQLLQGTPLYIAPEWLIVGGRPDVRSDLYSLGVVLYEMLTGQAPFPIHNLSELARVHRQGCRAEIRSLRPDVPQEVARLVRCLLARSPDRRPATAADLAELLRRLEIELFELR